MILNYLLLTNLYSNNNISACTDHFYDKYISCIFILHLVSFANQTKTRQEWLTILVCGKLYGGRKAYLYCIYPVCVLVLQRKPCLHLMNRLNSLKHVQYFDVYNSNQRKKRKKRKNSQFTTFFNTCNIMTPFELAHGKFTDTEYDYN